MKMNFNLLHSLKYIMAFTVFFFVPACDVSINTPVEDDSASQSATGDGVPEFGGKIARNYEDSEEWWPPEKLPPEDAPNIIIFLLDDTGFAQIGSFGGLIETPNIDALAAGGLRYNNFRLVRKIRG